MEIQAREKKGKRGKGMAYTIKCYLHYGIFERQLFDTIISRGTAGKVALAVWIAVTLAELFVLWRIHKKGGCTDEKSPGRREKTVGSDMKTKIRLLWKLLI